MEENQGVSESAARSFARAMAASEAIKTPLRMSCGEILRAARYAISLRLLSIHVIAFVPAYSIYLLCVYLSLLSTGQSLATAWTEWGLLPSWVAISGPPSAAAVILFGLGIIGLGAAFLLANTAGSRLLWMKRRGNIAFSIREAYDFAFGKFGAVIIAPGAVVILIALLASGGVLVGLVGKIPYIGQLVVTGFAWLWLLASFVLLLAFIIAALSFLLAPAIMATTEEGALEALFQIAGIVWSQPWRLLLYLVGVTLTAILGLIVVAFGMKHAFLLMDASFAMMVGNDYQNLSTQAQHLLQNWSAPLGRLLSKAPEVTSHFFFSRPLMPLALSPWLEVLARIFALSLLLAAVWALSYPLAIVNSGLTQTYLVLRRIKDGKNFLERPDADESTAP